MIKIPKEDFAARVERLGELMRRQEMGLCFVYGDEYRRENLRYISNVWPLFERGAAVVAPGREPVILGAPEGEVLSREMSAWPDIRVVPEFACVTVPEEIEYPFANYTSFRAVFRELTGGVQPRRVGVAGIDAMPKPLYDIIAAALDGAEILDAGPMLQSLRLSKSAAEIACVTRAIEIADEAYTALMEAAVPGATELQLAGAATGKALSLGAESVPFCLVASGERVNTIIGRATSKVIEDGDMILAALAVQYEGYIATFGFPFAAGIMSGEQRQLITWLIGAYERAKGELKAGVPQNRLVRAVKEYFREVGIGEYDLYPPLHGCGLSEAESPYPNEDVTAPFVRGMTLNTDISVFGHPYGSNRIETGFIVTDEGYIAPSKLFERLIRAWKSNAEGGQKA